VASLVVQALSARDRRDGVTFARVVRELAEPMSPDLRRRTEQVVGASLTSATTALWGTGWQPADVLRFVARRMQPPHQLLARSVIAEELSAYPPGTVDPGWSAQLAGHDVTRWWPRDLNALQACARSHGAGWGDFLIVALGLLHLFGRLPRLELLGPVPGTTSPERAASYPEVDERILARVRALLAKAESTPYPAEAETFTAGAQALMARHAIDHALLAASGQAPADEPVGRQIGIDNPYESAKVSLLSAIASANRCRAVWTKTFGFATVIGHPTDLDTVEVLFTSLLVQAITAITREGSRTSWTGGSRTRSFRRSFLLAYAERIRERLTETTEEQTRIAAAEPGKARLLPVLASRTEAVERTTSAIFPRLLPLSTGSVRDREGWASGRAAADRATLTSTAGEVAG